MGMLNLEKYGSSMFHLIVVPLEPPEGELADLLALSHVVDSSVLGEDDEEPAPITDPKASHYQHP